MLRRLAFVAFAVILGVGPLVAQDTTRRAGIPGKRDLELVPGRSVDVDTDEGTWISLDVSPDGKTVVFDVVGDLYSVPIGGGNITALACDRI